MRVLLINPPSPPDVTINREGAAGFGNRYGKAGAFLYPPHTLATAAAVLRDAGYDVSIFDATAERAPCCRETLERIMSVRPDVLVLLVSWSGWDDDLFFAEVLRAGRPDLPLVLIGQVLRDERRADYATQIGDLIVVGEPEAALPAACRHVAVAATGTVVAAGDLEPAAYGEGSYLSDIDALPVPAWDLVQRQHYPMLTVLGSRGCESTCTYCPYKAGWGSRLRLCSAGRLLHEVAAVQERYRPARLAFRDPAFAADRQRVVDLCEGILARRLAPAWECESRPEYFDADLLRLMHRAGCATVKLGVESAHPGRLHRIGRLGQPADAARYLAQVETIVRTCRQIHLRCHLFLLIGWPDEEEAEIDETVRFLSALDPQHITVKAVDPYPGTVLENIGAGDTRKLEARAARLLATMAPATEPAPQTLRRRLSWLRRRST